MNNRLIHIFLCFFLLPCAQVYGSHIVGGEATYQYLGSQTIGGVYCNKYEVSIIIYEDCNNGSPAAIEQDNPAFFAVYDSSGHLVEADTGLSAPPFAIPYQSYILVPANFSNLCISNPPVVCLLKKTFVKTYYLPPSPKGYVIAYQRCCRNAAILNVFDPGDIGATYYCRIPPTSIATTNNSAVFKNYPPQIICINNPLIYDHSATDVDGDSLTYAFCPSLLGANSTNIKPMPSPPPYNPVSYIPPYSYLYPMTGLPRIQIDTRTGLITGTPNSVGRYLVSVCCHEWRNGVLINTIFREFQFVVTNCSKSVVADIPIYTSVPNTYIIDCHNYTVNFVNTSIGGITYRWNFGVPSIESDTSTVFEPSFTYPDTGTYIVNLTVNPSSTCSDSIWRYVKIYPYFTTKFSDSGAQCPGSPLGFIDGTVSTMRPIVNWNWSFGDDTYSALQNPVHSYSFGGTYNVSLISGNYANCADTATQQMVIQNFKPFAGNDTTIVKDESIRFNAMGGIYFTWTPDSYLNNANIPDPVGYYPDTGTFKYYLHVISAYGCEGIDTIKVQVVNKATFFVPTAFSPNGDGLNDYFRPMAIGFKDLNYFRIFNRWGQMIYSSKNFETGWDGTFNDKKVDVDTYYWEISYTDRYGKQGSMKGDVTLLR